MFVKVNKLKRSKISNIYRFHFYTKLVDKH